MAAHNSDIDMSILDGGRQNVGVRHSAATLLEYDLTVVVGDGADAVRAAGGWMCDRVRAGWRVVVVFTGEADVRPFQVLGVRTMPAGTDASELVRSGSAAVAVAADVLRADGAVRAEVLRAAERGGTEITVWGDGHPGALAGRVTATRHDVSGAARAFKAQALAAAGASAEEAQSVEEFYSCALWYPPEGADLTPVG